MVGVERGLDGSFHRMKCWEKIPNVAYLDGLAKRIGMKKLSLKAMTAFFVKYE